MDSSNNNTSSEFDPAALCFEEYQDCFGEPRDVMKRHLLCNLCGGHLHFNHMADFKHGLVQETARCQTAASESVKDCTNCNKVISA